MDDRALVDLDGLAPDAPRWQSGAGVLLFAYAESAQALASRLEAATASARRMKALSPRLRVALATNGEPVRGVFDHIVAIEQRHVLDGGDPAAGKASESSAPTFRPVESQALTRIYYLARSPFALTLALEGTAIACAGGVDAALHALLDSAAEGEGQFDVAVSTQMQTESSHASTVLLIRANAATRALLRDWFVEHLNSGPTADPAPALARALARALAAGSLRRAALSSSFVAQVRHAPPWPRDSDGASSADAILGTVSFIHGAGRAFAPRAELDRLCERVTMGGAEPRALIAREQALGAPLDEAIAVVPFGAPARGVPSARGFIVHDWV